MSPPPSPRVTPTRSRPRRRLAAALALAGALVALGACGDATGPARGPLTAHWVSEGTGSGDVTGMPLTLTLVQDGAAVTGTGTVRPPAGDDVALTVEGTISGRVVTLALDGGAAAWPDTALLLQAMLSESEQRLTGTVTQGRYSEVRLFERR